MSYARTLRRSMLSNLRPLGNEVIESEVICRTKRGIFYGFRAYHPTKGWRYPGVRSAHAAAITLEVRRGLRPFSSLALHDVLAEEGII